MTRNIKQNSTRSALVLCVVVMLTLGLCGREAEAQWSRTPDGGIQLDGGIYGARLVTDSLGGVFLVALGGDWRAYCYYYDANGNRMWDRWVDVSPQSHYSGPSGIYICPEPGSVVVVTRNTWMTEQDTLYDIRAQMINTLGELVWGDSGVSITNSYITPEEIATFEPYSIAADGDGGIIVTWGKAYYEERFEDQFFFLRKDMFAQRISSAGETVWDDEGIYIPFPEDHNREASILRIVTDGNGGAFLSARDYLQRLTSEGDLFWGENGLDDYNGFAIGLVSDGFGGLLFYHSYRVNNMQNIFTALRYDSDGQAVWDDGIILRVHGYDETSGYHFVSASDSVFFLHRDRSPYIQGIDLNGAFLFDYVGIDLVPYGRVVRFPLSSNNSVIYVSRGSDRRGINESAIYAQRIDLNGENMWGEEVLLFSRPPRFSVSDAISDMHGGAIFMIDRYYLQHINRDGELGIPLTIRGFDQPLHPGIITYEVYPNPTNNFANVRFDIPIAREVSVSIYDVRGRHIATLAQGTWSAGSHSVVWDGAGLSAGIYFVKMEVFSSFRRKPESRENVFIQKAVLVK